MLKLKSFIISNALQSIKNGAINLTELNSNTKCWRPSIDALDLQTFTVVNVWVLDIFSYSRLKTTKSHYNICGSSLHFSCVCSGVLERFPYAKVFVSTYKNANVGTHQSNFKFNFDQIFSFPRCATDIYQMNCIFRFKFFQSESIIVRIMT